MKEPLEDSASAACVAAYRESLEVGSARNTRDVRRALRQGKTVAEAGLASLIVLAVKERMVLCQYLSQARLVTVHTQRYWRLDRVSGRMPRIGQADDLDRKWIRVRVIWSRDSSICVVSVSMGFGALWIV